MIVDLIMIGLLGWQIVMPAVNNGQYMFQIDRDGTVIRMNTSGLSASSRFTNSAAYAKL